MKPAILRKATSQTKLIDIKLDKANLCSAREVDVGIAVKKIIVEKEQKKLVSELQKLEFYNECQTFLKTLAMKIMEKSPLTQPIARYSAVCSKVYFSC